MARNKTIDKMMSAVRESDRAVAGEEEASTLESLQTELTEDSTAGIVTGAEPEPTEPPAEPPTQEPETPPAAPAPAAPAPTPAPAEPTPPAAPAAAPAGGNEETPAERREREGQRREIARLRAELAAARQRQAVAPAAPATPAPAAPATPAPAPVNEDPEPPAPGPRPNREEFPIQYDEWRDRVLEHQSWETRQLQRTIAENNERLNGVTRQNEEQRIAGEFDRGIELQRTAFAQTNPTFDSAREYLRSVVRRQQIRGGAPEFQVDEIIRAQERQFIARHMQEADRMIQAGILPPETNRAAYAFEQMIGAAEDVGWSPTAAPAAAPAAGTPAPKTPAERIAHNQKVANAARSSSTMRTTPAEITGADPMTAQKFLEMSAMQRLKYKQAHPNWEKDLGFESESENFIIASSR